MALLQIAGRWLSIWCCLLLFTPLARGSDDDAEAVRRPLLRATYWVDGSEKPLVARDEPLPALRLSAGQSPDPRLPATGWRAEWHGVLEVLHPGLYRFEAETSGELHVRIDGQAVLSAPQADAQSIGPEIELTFGLHEFVVEFVPEPGDVVLKLQWSSDQFRREPLPAHALGQTDDSPRADQAFERGWLAVEEHSCTACHAATTPFSQQLLQRPGPHLNAGSPRLRAGWIYSWLDDPQAWRPEAVMPRLFSPDRQGEVERYAVALLLGSDDRSVAALGTVEPEVSATGKRLFHSIGCTACHAPSTDRPAHATLQRLHEKTTPEALAAFIQHPSEFDPAGRMPKLGLSDEETQAIAQYLHQRDRTDQSPSTLPAAPTSAEVATAFAALSVDADSQTAFSNADDDERLKLLARAVLQQRHCTSCHEVRADGEEPAWVPQPAKLDFAAIALHPERGCLDSRAERSDGVPRFAASLARSDVVEFLTSIATAPGTPAPGAATLRQIERLNCMACHQRNESGGLSAELLATLLASQSNDNDAESIAPPQLTGVADKLTGDYLRAILLEDRRERPWMPLRMPRFHPTLVADLPIGLAALDGDRLIERPDLPPVDAELAAAGRELIGSRGFGCIKCHDLLDVASSGTRGPNLAGVPGRVNYDWFQRWMIDPQRIQPGTRMPTVFLEDQSPYREILAGDPERQREALWHYLISCRELPYPEGLRMRTQVFCSHARTAGRAHVFARHHGARDRHPLSQPYACRLRRAIVPRGVCVARRLFGHDAGLDRARRPRSSRVGPDILACPARLSMGRLALG